MTTTDGERSQGPQDRRPGFVADGLPEVLELLALASRHGLGRTNSTGEEGNHAGQRQRGS
ncbi:hypothetical protein ABT075_40415 [Streptomyces sp. NPDC002677]|uniref:hypothetical protein n=1 Tax=Streptomyces sp. NPDC002677 TaxID=3154774 RepID=UPI00331EB04A